MCGIEAWNLVFFCVHLSQVDIEEYKKKGDLAVMFFHLSMKRLACFFGGFFFKEKKTLQHHSEITDNYKQVKKPRKFD